jgi:hypothetical protein
MTYILATYLMQNRIARCDLYFEEWQMVLGWLVLERQYAEVGSAATVGWPRSWDGMDKEEKQSAT